MTILDSVLASWKENKDIESLITQKVFTDQDAIQACLTALPEKEKAQARNILNEIEEALLQHISELENSKNEVKEQIDNNNKTAQACLLYGARVETKKE